MTNNIIGTQISLLRKKFGLTQEDLANKLGFSKQTVSNWETGLKTPRMGAIQKIADLFNVSKSFIIEGIDESKNSSIEKIYNQLESPRQQKVYDFAENQLKEQKQEQLKIQETKKQTPNSENDLSEFEKYRNRKIISGRATAAGAPVDGDTQDSQSSVMIIDQREVPSDADEIVTIAGDSMEPLLLEGEQVFIHWTPVVEQGEIALVSIVDEGVTCKKVYWDNDVCTLRSINEAYEDMVYPLSDIRIIGKVL